MKNKILFLALSLVFLSVYISTAAPDSKNISAASFHVWLQTSQADFSPGEFNNTEILNNNITIESENLIANNSFEQWTGGIPDNWLKYCSENCDTSLLIEQTSGSNIHSGTSAIKISDILPEGYQGISQALDKDFKGHSLYFSVWLKTGNADESNQRCRVVLTDSNTHYIKYFVAEKEWKKFEIAFSSIEKLNNIRIYPTAFNDPNPGSIIVDDVKISDTYKSSGYFISGIHDSGSENSLARVLWNGAVPEETSATLQIRASDNSDMSGAGEWETAESNPDTSFSFGVKKYYQYKLIFTSSNPEETPTISDVRFEFGNQFGYISGTVTDAKHNPVSNVKIKTELFTSYSDKSGRFAMPCPQGDYDVLFLKDNYKNLIQSKVSVSDYQTTILNAQLEPDGEWNNFSRNRGHTRNSLLSVNMKRPETAWKYKMKNVNPSLETTADVNNDNIPETIAIHAEKMFVYKNDSSLLWKSEADVGTEIGCVLGVFDLDNNGTKEIVTGNKASVDSAGLFRMARIVIFDGSSGTIVFVRDFFDAGNGHCGTIGHGSANSLNKRSTCIADTDGDGALELFVIGDFVHGYTLLDFSNGVSNGEMKFFKSYPNNDVSGIAVGNICGTAALEVVAEWNGTIYVYDPLNGDLIKQYSYYDSADVSGALVLADVDGDNYDEIIRIWPAAESITAFDCDDSGLSVKWKNDGIKGMNYSYGSVCDIDGDNQIEIVAGKDTDDICVYSALDGSVEKLIAGRTLCGFSDIDSDGINEILAGTDSKLSNPFLIDYKSGTYLEVASFPDKRWIHGPMFSEYNPKASYFSKDTGVNLGYYKNSFLIQQNNSVFSYSYKNETLSHNWTYKYNANAIRRDIAASIFDSDKNGTDETMLFIDDGTLRVLDEQGILSSNTYPDFGSLYDPLVADLSNNGKNKILVQKLSETSDSPEYYEGKFTLLDASGASLTTSPVEILWGFGATFPDNIKNIQYRPVIDDIDFDNLKETILMTSDSYLKVLNHTGSLRWQYNFNGVYMGTGFFNEDNVKDIYVCDLSHNFRVLNGKNGSLIWSGKKTSLWIPAVSDTDRDGIDDIIALGENNFVYAYKGKDGSILWQDSSNCAMCNSGTPALIDINNDGLEEIITSGNFGIVVYSSNGILLWEQKDINTEGFKNHFGTYIDADDDGFTDIIQPGNHGIYAISGKTGEELWRYCPEPKIAVSSISAADIDGDRKEEIIFSDNKGYLRAVNKENGILIWLLKFEYQLGSPIIADSDNDGEPEILVSSNGYLYCLDKGSALIKENILILY